MNKEIIARISSWKKGIKSMPYGIELSPTLRCNLNCKFCWRYGKEKIDFGKELNKEKYFEILEEAHLIGVKEVKIIGGGEPTFKRDIIEIMKRIKEFGMYGYICTNGTLLKEEDMSLLVKMGWDHVKISFHGAKETHDSLTGVPGSYNKVIKNIQLIKKYKTANESRLPFIEFGFVLGKPNFREVPDMIQLAHKYGVSSVFIEPITAYSDTGKGLKMNKEEEAEFIGIAENAYLLSEQHKISTNLPNFFKGGFIGKTNAMQDLLVKKQGNSFNSISCFEPFYRMGIRADGIVCPCGFFDEGSNESINEKSLKEIWLGDYFEKRRQEMINGKLSEYCSRCCTTLVSNNIAIQEELVKIG